MRSVVLTLERRSEAGKQAEMRGREEQAMREFGNSKRAGRAREKQAPAVSQLRTRS